MANDIKIDLVAFLKSKTAIKAIVGRKIYPGHAPSSASLPYITFSRISEPPHHHMGAAAGIASPTFQVDSWGRNSKQVSKLSEAIRNAIDGFTGLMGTNDVRVARITRTSDDEEAQQNGTQQPAFRIGQDILIWYLRSVPTLT